MIKETNEEINIDGMTRRELIEFSKHAIKINLSNFKQGKKCETKNNRTHRNFKCSVCLNIIIGIIFLFLYLYYSDRNVKYVYLLISFALIIYSLYLIYDSRQMNEDKNE